MALEYWMNCLGEQCTAGEVIRCVQVSPLCVQQRTEDRPDMPSVVLMLNGEKLLPKPKVLGGYILKQIVRREIIGWAQFMNFISLC